MSSEEALQHRVNELEKELTDQATKHNAELSELQGELAALHKQFHELSEKVKVVSCGSADVFTRRVTWTIEHFVESEYEKGMPVWSPRFRVAGMDGVQLEFYPKGREKTAFEGFCSLFLWCPSGSKITYQLWVGSYARAPDTDEYEGMRAGHGHSNFCPLEPEVDKENGSITIGVDVLDVQREVCKSGLRLVTRSLDTIVANEAEVLQNKSVNRVVWKINSISARMKQLPRGTSMWSRLFTAGGIREVLLEFYPNGSTSTKGDGFCAFYIRCPEDISMVVTLFIGKVRKGPIKVTFDGMTGKGLPEFCQLQEEINVEDDSVEVGIELQNQPHKTLQLKS